MENNTRRTDDIGFGGMLLLQDPSQFCYGLDAVLLADFAPVRETDFVLELGSGNGAASLILYAKYHPRKITGAELQRKPYALAVESAALNGLSDRVCFLHTDILELPQLLEPASFDVVISNPPYTAKGSGLVNAADVRGIARHETTAALQDFTDTAALFLKPGGHFCMVHRPSRLVDILCCCRKSGLEPKRMRFVCPKTGCAANLVLIDCVRGGGRELKLLPELIVREEDGSFTPQTRAIYESYYRK